MPVVLCRTSPSAVSRRRAPGRRSQARTSGADGSGAVANGSSQYSKRRVCHFQGEDRQRFRNIVVRSGGRAAAVRIRPAPGVPCRHIHSLRVGPAARTAKSSSIRGVIRRLDELWEATPLAFWLVLAACAYFAVMAVRLTVIDVRHHLLPNRIVFPSYAVAGVLLAAAAVVHGGDRCRTLAGRARRRCRAVRGPCPADPRRGSGPVGSSTLSCGWSIRPAWVSAT